MQASKQEEHGERAKRSMQASKQAEHGEYVHSCHSRIATLVLSQLNNRRALQ